MLSGSTACNKVVFQYQYLDSALVLAFVTLYRFVLLVLVLDSEKPGIEAFLEDAEAHVIIINHHYVVLYIIIVSSMGYPRFTELIFPRHSSFCHSVL